MFLGFTALGFKATYKATPYKFPVLHSKFPAMPVAANNAVSTEGADLGRHLFYDPILSNDSTIACASCHKQEAAFSDAPKDFSIGITGTKLKRNTMPLYNLAWYTTFFWDGKASSIEDQVFHPLRAADEMGIEWNNAAERVRGSAFYRKKFKAAFGDQPIDSVLIAKAIAQFERTLLSYRSKYDRVMAGRDVFTPEEQRGYELVNDMEKGDCWHCHTTREDALGTTLTYRNNGLDTVFTDRGRITISGNAFEEGAFKIPSIRNLSFTAPYMHDGRFKTLEEVLDFYISGVKPGKLTDPKMRFAHQGGARLNAREKAQIIVFLKTLDDSSFVNDPAFRNPFE